MNLYSLTGSAIQLLSSIGPVVAVLLVALVALLCHNRGIAVAASIALLAGL